MDRMRREPADEALRTAAPFGVDAYSPAEIARRIEDVGVAKARQPWLQTAMLGTLGGAFIALGALWYTLVASDASLGFAASRIAGGVVFSLGLVLVVVAGAELFTGNNLLAMAWADRRIGAAELLRHWGIVLAGNCVGAVAMAYLAVWSGYVDLNGGAVAETAVRIAAKKAALPAFQAFFAGVLCNVLVCLAVWLAMAGRSVVDKVVAIVFPIAAFVAAGFEHSIANLYFISLGLLLRDSMDAAAIPGIGALDWSAFVRNLVPVTLGNIVGGSGLVALVYHVIYRLAPRLALARAARTARAEARNEERF
jgi:formate transporter